MRLLLVEDDRMIGDSLRLALRQEGHAVDWVYDAAAAQAALASERFDLVLLDLGLPEPERLGSGLDAGADDYLGGLGRPGRQVRRRRLLLDARPRLPGAAGQGA